MQVQAYRQSAGRGEITMNINDTKEHPALYVI